MSVDTIARALALSATTGNATQTAIATAAAVQAGISRTTADASATLAANYLAALQALAANRLFVNSTNVATLPAGVTSVVADGEPFLIQGVNGGTVFASLYRRAGTTGIVQGLDLPSAALLSMLGFKAPWLSVGGVADADERFFELIMPDGTHEFSKALIDYLTVSYSMSVQGLLKLAGMTLGGQTPASAGFSLSDIDERSMLDFDPATCTLGVANVDVQTLNGVAIAKVISASGQRRVKLRSRLYLILVLGQSWAAGSGGNPIATSSQRFSSTVLMPVTGVRPGDGSADPAVQYASFVPLVAGVNPLATSQGETPAAGIGEALVELLASESASDWALNPSKFALMSFGISGAHIADISATTPVNNVKAGLDGIVAWARAQDMDVTLLGGTLQLGVSDLRDGTSYATFQAGVSAYRQTIETYAKSIRLIEASDRFPLFVSQVGWTGTYGTLGDAHIDYALLDLARSDANVYLTNPQVHLDVNDAPHLTANGSRGKGSEDALAIKRVALEGGEWPDLGQNMLVKRQAEHISLFFPDADGGLMDWTSTTLGTIADMGFRLFRASDNVQVSLAQRPMISGCRLLIEGVSDPGPCYLLVGSGTNPGGSNLFEVGSYTFDPSGTNHPVRRMMPICRIDIA